MKLRAQYEGLALLAIIVTANLAKDTLMKITADHTVDWADTEDDIAIGRLVKPAKEASGDGTVETRFKELIEIRADGAIAAGDWVKIGSDDNGLQCVKKFTPLGVAAGPALTGDSPELLFGICWKGGADNATVEVLVL